MLSHIKRKILYPCLGEIWCLHRVLPNRSECPSNRELQITPEYLTSLIAQYKRDEYQFVSLDSITSHPPLCSRYFSRKRCAITFDDGYKDIYDSAFPIFRKEQIPFTIYLTTGMPDGTACLWWEQLEKMTSSSEEYELVLKKIIQDPRNMQEVFCDYFHCEPDVQLTKDLSLTWAQLQEMVDSGLCTIGSHTMSHPGLTKIDIESVKKELLLSKDRILQQLGISVRHFSYPHSMMNKEIAEWVELCGYQTAAMGYGGETLYGDSAYKLKRKYIVMEN